MAFERTLRYSFMDSIFYLLQDGCNPFGHPATPNIRYSKKQSSCVGDHVLY